MRSLAVNLDFVLCIDVSENMKNHISSVKESIGRLYSDICESMEKRGKIHQCRMRILTFHSSAELCRDFVSATDFFSLPEEREIFSKYVQDIEVNQTAMSCKTDWNVWRTQFAPAGTTTCIGSGKSSSCGATRGRAISTTVTECNGGTQARLTILMS